MRDLFVSIIAPVYNDGPIVAGFVKAASELLARNYSQHEILIVDDGSHDQTTKIMDGVLAETPAVRYIRLTKHYGQETAISAGLDTVIGDYVVIMSPRRDPLSAIPPMVEQAMIGNGVVYGVTPLSGYPAILRIGAPVFYWYCRRFLRLYIPQRATDFITLSRTAVNAIIKTKHISNYTKLFLHYTGLKNQEFPYEPLRDGKSDDVAQKAKTALDIIVSHSSHPLRLVTILGLTASALNVIYMGYVVVIHLMLEEVAEGWTTSSLQSATMFFLVFLILAVFSEYLGKIMNEIKGKEPYVIEEEKSSSVLTSADLEKRRNIVRHSA